MRILVREQKSLYALQITALTPTSYQAQVQWHIPHLPYLSLLHWSSLSWLAPLFQTSCTVTEQVPDQKALVSVQAGLFWPSQVEVELERQVQLDEGWVRLQSVRCSSPWIREFEMLSTDRGECVVTLSFAQPVSSMERMGRVFFQKGLKRVAQLLEAMAQAAAPQAAI